MQFKKSAVVGVLVMLHLSADSWCRYIPAKKTSASKKNATDIHSEQIQICGNALTTLVIEACDGIVGSFDQVNSTRSSVQTKITEDCCDHVCTLEYLQNYCGETPLFSMRKPLQGKLLSKLRRNRPSSVAASEKEVEKNQNKKKKGVSEVRTRNKNGKWGKSRKKRKRSFKMKCAYKSFGHYLLKLERRGRAKEQNGINRTWPSIEVGTISPEMDKFGGQPIVVVRKNKSNSV